MKFLTSLWCVPVALVSLSTTCFAATTYRAALAAGGAHDAASQYGLARQDFETASKLANTPDDKAQVLIALAAVDSHENSYVSACLNLEQALKLPGVSEVTKASARFLLGMSLVNNRQYSQGRRMLRQALRDTSPFEKEPSLDRTLDIRDSIALSYAGEGNFDAAYQEFNDILATPGILASRTRATLLTMGRTYLNQGNPTQARQLMTKLLQFNQDTMAAVTTADQAEFAKMQNLAYQLLGDSYVQTKELPQAKEAYQKAAAVIYLPASFRLVAQEKLNALAIAEQSPLAEKVAYFDYKTAVAVAEAALNNGDYTRAQNAALQAVELADRPQEKPAAANLLKRVENMPEKVVPR